MSTPPFTITRVDPLSADAQACLNAYFQELEALFDSGFDPTKSVSAHPEELVAPAGCFMLARAGTNVIGCGGLKINTTDATAEVKRMWVVPEMRGRGVAKQLLHALEAFALHAGVNVIRLDTHAKLKAARALYLRHGYTEIPPYNLNPYAHHWFQKHLTNCPLK